MTKYMYSNNVLLIEIKSYKFVEQYNNNYYIIGYYMRMYTLLTPDVYSETI